MPGLFPKRVDASGCRKPDSSYVSPMDHSAQKGPGFYNEQFPHIPKSSKNISSDEKVDSAPDSAAKRRDPEADAATERSGPGLEKRQVSDTEPTFERAKPKVDCVAQGLDSPPGSGWEDFTIGGMADSIYEYLPKEYMLLGGLEKKYQTMYAMAAEAIKKNLIFRPMIEDEERNILVAGLVSTSGKPSTTVFSKLKSEHTHLTCFAGGMFALGAKLFNRKDDIDIAKRLTDGCVWAYEMTPTGIMPEHFLITPCEDVKSCPFNEILWYEKLYHYHSRSLTRPESKQAILDDSKKESSGQAAAKISRPDSVDDELPSKVEKTKSTDASTTALRKRQLGDIENDKLIQADKQKKADVSKAGPEATDIVSKDRGKDESSEGDSKLKEDKPAEEGGDTSKSKGAATPTSTEEGPDPVAPVVKAYTPLPIPSQEDYAKTRIRDEKLPKGVIQITGSKYILRPEAVESVFIMYRVTGDDYWRKKGWNMFTAIQNHTRTEYGASAISDVMSKTPYLLDEMESFWLAETLKYLYLLFSEPDYYSLDDYVLYGSPCTLFRIVVANCYRNTEAHPFKRPK